MLLATWGTALNILVFAALVAAVIYLFVLIVRALKKYIGSISYKTLSATLKELENVIGVAAGGHKVDAIRAVLRGKYLDVLITDEATALQLLSRQGS